MLLKPKLFLRHHPRLQLLSKLDAPDHKNLSDYSEHPITSLLHGPLGCPASVASSVQILTLLLSSCICLWASHPGPQLPHP